MSESSMQHYRDQVVAVAVRQNAEPCAICGRAGETPWVDDEWACYECAGDPKAHSVRKRLGWALCTFYDARIPVLAEQLNDQNRARFLKMPYAGKCNIIGKMIESGKMI